MARPPRVEEEEEEEEEVVEEEEEVVEEEEDYMNMTFDDAAEAAWAGAPAPSAETSLQRRQRLRREGEARARVKSKAELAAEAACAREEALSRSLLEGARARRSKGLAMMAKMGFKAGDALGAATGRPVASSSSAAAAAAAAATTATTTTTNTTTTSAAAAAAAAAVTSDRYDDGGKDNNNNNNNNNKTERGEDAVDGEAPPPDLLLEPIRLQIKEDRGGIGLDSERKRKVNEAAAERRQQENKRSRVDVDEFRDRVRRAREVDRLERQVYAAMKVCEGMDEENRGGGQGQGQGRGASADDGDADDVETGDGHEDEDTRGRRRRSNGTAFSTRPLRSIPVEWRGLVRRREQAERDRRMRYDLEQSSTTPASSARLPTYADDLDGDEADRTAMGRTAAVLVPVEGEDLDDEDDELDGFAALEPEERLRRVVGYLRAEFRYCFWCKHQYPDAGMEGCPGPTEEDHD